MRGVGAPQFYGSSSPDCYGSAHQGSSTNQRPVFRSGDHARPIRGQHHGHVITLDQSEIRINVMGPPPRGPASEPDKIFQS